MFAMLLLICSGCSHDKKLDINKPSNLNYFGGIGDLKVNEFGTLYDDSGVYLKPSSGNLLYRIDENEEVSVACGDVACTHNDSNCNAYCPNRSTYFIFNKELYMTHNEEILSADATSETLGKIYRIDGAEKKEVFTNKIPDDIDEELKQVDSNEIDEVDTYNSDYILLMGNQHNYVLNQKFEIVYSFVDLGKVCKAFISGDSLYYINSLFELVETDLKTGKQSILIEHKDTKISDFAIDISNQTLYYTNFDYKIYKRGLYDIKNQGVYLYTDSFLIDLYGDKLYTGGKIYDIKTKQKNECDAYLRNSDAYAVTTDKQYMIVTEDEGEDTEKTFLYILKDGKINQTKEINIK